MSWKWAQLDGGWICTLCNWRQTQGAPDILASRVHWCNNCRKKRPSLWSQTSGPHFLQRFLQAEFLNSTRPSSCAGGPQVVDLRCLQYLPDGSVSFKINYIDQWRPQPQRRRKNKADNNTITKMYKASMRTTSTKWQHLQQLKKVLPSFLWCTASWRLETEHRILIPIKAGTPGHQRNMLNSLRIRTCMVLSNG